MKQTRLWLTTIAVLLCSLVASAHDFVVGGIYYNIKSTTDLTVAVTYGGSSYDSYSNEYSGAVTIPETVTYNNNTYSVTSIGNYAFYNCSSLTTITLPESVTSIGNYAFEDCSSLYKVINNSKISLSKGTSSNGYVAYYAKVVYQRGKFTTVGDFQFYTFDGIHSLVNYIGNDTEIVLPDSYNGENYKIGDCAFSGCRSLAAITLPESVTSIGDYAFQYCSSLTSITIPEGVTSIGNYAFHYCSSLTSITLPESVTSIGNYAFHYCSSLTSITLPESVTSIGDYAFQYCSSLTSITIPEGMTSIGNYAFRGCSSLAAITLPEGVTSIGDYAFHYCRSLAAITLPESVTSIKYAAFYGCSSLAAITLPEGVTSIGDYAFEDCSSLYKVINNSKLSLSKGSSSNGYVAYYAKVVYQGDELTTVGDFQFYTSDGIHSLVNYIGNDTEIVLPDSYNGENYKIGDCAFSGCSILTSITIPEGVTSIGNYAFRGCSSLAAITLPEGVTSIGGSAFSGCSSLATITIPEGVTSIGSSAFSGCSSLTTITIPEGVTSIGNYAFGNCTALKKVIIEDGSTTLSLGYNSYYSNGTGEGLFYDCPLEEVYLGRDLSYYTDKYYGYSPFYNKDALTKVTIGNEVTIISQYVLYGCYNIHSLTMGNGVLSIEGNTFSTPDKVIWLTNTPPTGYTYAKGSINYVANDQYTSLSNVKVYPYLSSMFEVDGVKYVPVSPSERTCHAIDCAYDSTATTINVGETASFKGVAMKITEVMPYTFYENKHIKEVSVSHLGNIGDYAFYDCDGIKSVDIRNQGSIGSQAFYGCNGLEMAFVANWTPVVSSNNDVPLTFADWTSTNKTHSSTSSETYTFTVGEEAALSFSWSVSSESGYDKLIVTLDGTTILEKSGSLSGTYSNAISKGSHTLVVKYTKDSGGSSGLDQASISNIIVSKGSATELIAGVGDEAFSGCSSLKTVTLGDSIGALGDKAFYQCTNLLEIVVPNSVKVVGEYCFSGCSTMTNVELGNSVATINNYAFQNCSSLSEICIPQSTNTIGDYAFYGCSQLANVIIEDRTTALALGSNGSSALFADCPLDSVYIGGKITYSTTSSKGYSPFYRNTSLRSVVITDREEQIYANEFYGCTNLQNVTIGNGVKSIGNYAFSGCSSLEGFSFGSNMESIGAEAFSDCTNLTSITSHAAVPPTCGTQALDDINKWECVLGVPLGNADAYYAADQWKEFFFIEDVVEVDHYVLTYVVDGEIVHTEVLKHKDAVTMLAEPTKVGYEFSGWDKTLTTMPAEDVTISGTFTRLPIENLVILDTETAFAVDEEIECEVVTYIRHFDDTQWQALYVPFEIPVTEEFLANFEVADLNNVHQYDRDDDGMTDETVIEAFKMTSGVLETNYPYLIRAKEKGEKSITVTDAVLYATEENSIDCSSVRDKFTFTGTYSSLSSAELPQGEGYYTLIEGEWKPVTEAVKLGAFRFFLKVDSRSGVAAAEARSIRMRIIGENGEDDTTEIEHSEFNTQNSAIIYDLQGRRVENPTKGIYIVNGKRVVIR